MKTREEKYKITPYEPCPCGSEKKYKFCCYPRRNEVSKELNFEGYSDSRRMSVFNHYWGKTDFKTCFVKDNNCENVIKNAHTIQNNGVLSRISEEGHVYTIFPTVINGNSEPEFKKISKNNASTFTGFCNYHDTEIFKPIEQTEYKNNDEQNFLFNYRGFCIEYHKKIRQLQAMQNGFKNAPSWATEPTSIRFYRVACIDKEQYEKIYNKMNADLKTKNYDSMKNIYLNLNYKVNFAVSSAFSLEYDMEGTIINNLEEFRIEDMPFVFLNIFPSENQTHILFSCRVEHENIYGELFKQLETAKTEDILKYLNFLIINYIENVYFRISWIESLPKEEKESILKSYKLSLAISFNELIQNIKFFNFNLFSV